jgi:hypothetical protein
MLRQGKKHGNDGISDQSGHALQRTAHGGAQGVGAWGQIGNWEVPEAVQVCIIKQPMKAKACYSSAQKSSTLPMDP